MADLISPGVQVKEKDLTTSVASGATSVGAFAGIFEKGPISQVIIIDSEETLVSIFGKPNGTNFRYWFTAASFLMYGNTLKVVRILTTAAKNATSNTSGLLVKNNKHYSDGDGTTGPYNDGSAAVGIFAARSAGAWGNNIFAQICATGDAFQRTTDSPTARPTLTAAYAAGVGAVALSSVSGFEVGNIIYLQETNGQRYRVTAINSLVLDIVRYPDSVATGLTNAVASGDKVDRYWKYYEQFDSAPGTSQYAADRSGVNDEMHIIITDEDSGITGVAGEILEKYENVSKASDALTDNGTANYYVDVLYDQSSYIYWMDHPAGATNWGSAALGITFTVPTASLDGGSMSGGIGGSNAPTEGERQTAYDYFKDADTESINLLISGPADAVPTGTATTHGVYITDLVDKRKDCVAFMSPPEANVVNVATEYTQQANVMTYFDALSSSSYVVYDSGWTKQYDKYNDVMRWVPLNGHIAGACARTDALEDPWWSPAGLARGQIRGSIALAFNPALTARDVLYKGRVNPVVTFPGEGTMLWGDKTALSRNSAFSRINVRRLFLTIEDAIKLAARSVLFEFNDEFTRSNFTAMVNPYLRDVQARRGMTDFLVVCDSTNNTPQVIDNNEFRADIYIKPARSINFITLTFVATRTGVDFSEVVGRA